MARLTEEAIDNCLRKFRPEIFGAISGVEGSIIKLRGLGGRVRLGDCVTTASKDGKTVEAEIVAIEDDLAIAASFESPKGLAAGDRASVNAHANECYPSAEWVGRVLDPFCRPLDGEKLPIGDQCYFLESSAPAAMERKMLGPRQETGLAAFDTFLPICRGQRLGIFAGPGVGKSTLLGDFVRGVGCDIAVIGLVGERSREVRAFIENTLGADGMKKSILIVSTADQSPLAKKRAAQLAQTTAEYFRDRNRQVLLVIDSLTRFAEAHREIALSVGEQPSLHAYPPSTFRTIASLVERAGPGVQGTGDISAIYSVLVAGSDMNEPVADMVQGILDGTVVLTRKIAERGRYPAINISKSISRSLPGAATQAENSLLNRARSALNAYEEAEAMIRAGLYAPGSDPRIDHAITIWPKLDAFIACRDAGSIDGSFLQLEKIVSAEGITSLEESGLFSEDSKQAS